MGSVGITAALEIGEVLAVNHAMVERVFHVAAVNIIEKTSDVLGTLYGAWLARWIVCVDDGHYGIGGVKRLQALGIAGSTAFRIPAMVGEFWLMDTSLISVDLWHSTNAGVRGHQARRVCKPEPLTLTY